MAAYFVHWTVGHVPEQGAYIDLILGKWGLETSARDRLAIALEYRVIETGPTMMVIDARHRPIASSDLVERALDRSEVVGEPVAIDAFAVADAVLGRDSRIAEILCGWTINL